MCIHKKSQSDEKNEKKKKVKNSENKKGEKKESSKKSSSNSSEKTIEEKIKKPKIKKTSEGIKKQKKKEKETKKSSKKNEPTTPKKKEAVPLVQRKKYSHKNKFKGILSNGTTSQAPAIAPNTYPQVLPNPNPNGQKMLFNMNTQKQTLMSRAPTAPLVFNSFQSHNFNITPPSSPLTLNSPLNSPLASPVNGFRAFPANPAGTFASPGIPSSGKKFDRF